MDKNISDEMFSFVFEMAFRDATLRSAFQNPYKDDVDEEKKFSTLKKQIKNKTESIVKEYISRILSSEEPGVKEPDTTKCIMDVITAAHKDIVWKNNVNKNQDFTFGNAQKLVNMTAKYFFILCYDNPGLMDRFKECHCPMDSIMIKIVLDKIQNHDISTIIDDAKPHLNKNTTWSTLSLEKDNTGTPNEYSEFQKIIKHLADQENISPIQFDYKYWDPDSSI